MSTMKAIGHRRPVVLDAADALESFEIERPTPGPRDLLVAVHGVSMNPVDVKVRAAMAPEGDQRVLGYDASGVVVAVGEAVSDFQPGDAVWYAGDITRPGSNAELQLVDERIVGRKPRSLDHAEAAALPLTAITAWEILFDCFRLAEGDGEGETLLVIGGAGGVGSILTQLARRLTKLTVVATASRTDTRDWVARMGAHHVIDHREPLDASLAELELAPRYVAALTHTDRHFDAIVEAIAPRGHIAMIDDPEALELARIKPKALTLSWEFMFARSMFQAADMDAQQRLLNRVSALVDAGEIVTTANRHLGAMSVETLLQAHGIQESGRAIGKTVLNGFSEAAAHVAGPLADPAEA